MLAAVAGLPAVSRVTMALPRVQVSESPSRPGSVVTLQLSLPVACHGN